MTEPPCSPWLLLMKSFRLVRWFLPRTSSMRSLLTSCSSVLSLTPSQIFLRTCPNLRATLHQKSGLALRARSRSPPLLRTTRSSRRPWCRSFVLLLRWVPLFRVDMKRVLRCSALLLGIPDQSCLLASLLPHLHRTRSQATPVWVSALPLISLSESVAVTFLTLPLKK